MTGATGPRPRPGRRAARRPWRGRARSSCPSGARRAPRRCGSRRAGPPRPRRAGRARAKTIPRSAFASASSHLAPSSSKIAIPRSRPGRASSRRSSSSSTRARCTLAIATLNRSPISSASASASSLSTSASSASFRAVGAEAGPARPVDRERVQRAHARPAVLRVGHLERAPPDRLGLLELVPRPRHPPREQQRPRDRPRVAELLGRGERAFEQPLGLVEVRLDVDRDVAEEPQGEREGERVAGLRAELHRAFERVGRGRVLAEPVVPLADAGERARLAHAPPVQRTRERERPLVPIDRRAALEPAPRAVAGRHERVGGAFGRRPVVGVEVERRERRELEVVGGPGRVAARDAAGRR